MSLSSPSKSRKLTILPFLISPRSSSSLMTWILFVQMCATLLLLVSGSRIDELRLGFVGAISLPSLRRLITFLARRDMTKAFSIFAMSGVVVKGSAEMSDSDCCLDRLLSLVILLSSMCIELSCPPRIEAIPSDEKSLSLNPHDDSVPVLLDNSLRSKDCGEPSYIFSCYCSVSSYKF